jgi:2',3'-cyclic-nucleotide 2'-phosphodiesterase (5'-nucleotidase family)
VCSSDLNDFIKDSITTNVYPVLNLDDDPDSIFFKPLITHVVDRANEITDPITKEVLGTMETGSQLIDRVYDQNKETALGHLVTDGWLAEAQKAGYNVDLAVVNAGGLRADLQPADNGDVTYGMLGSISPFNNELYVIKTSGAHIRELLNQQYDTDGYPLLYIAGLSYTYGPSSDDNYVHQVVDMTLTDGTKVSDDGVYTVLIPDFLYNGGDNFTALEGDQLVDNLGTDLSNTVAYFKDLTQAGQKIPLDLTSHKIETNDIYNPNGSSEQVSLLAVHLNGEDGSKKTVYLDKGKTYSIKDLLELASKVN